MPHVNDLKLDKLRSAGGGSQVGALPEMFLGFMQDADPSVDNDDMNTCEDQFVTFQGYKNGNLNDSWHDGLGTILGHTGSLNDRWFSFWAA